MGKVKTFANILQEFHQQLFEYFLWLPDIILQYFRQAAWIKFILQWSKIPQKKKNATILNTMGR